MVVESLFCIIMIYECLSKPPETEAQQKKTAQQFDSGGGCTLERLKGRQLEGRKFRRQHGIGPYILDFFCPSESLSIELDGEVHFSLTASERDQKRSDYLKGQGIHEVRFENQDVFNNIEELLRSIRAFFRNEV